MIKRRPARERLGVRAIECRFLPASAFHRLRVSEVGSTQTNFPSDFFTVPLSSTTGESKRALNKSG